MSHVVSIMLHPEKWQRDDLKIKFHMSKQAFNRVRDEWLKRRRLYHQHPEFRKAHRMDPRDKNRRKAFIAIQKEVGFYSPEFKYNQITPHDKNLLFEGTDIAYHLNAEHLRRIGGMAAQAVWNYHIAHREWRSLPPSQKIRVGEPKKPRPKRNGAPIVAALSGVSFNKDQGVVRIGKSSGGSRVLKVPFNVNRLKYPKILESLSDTSDNNMVMVCQKKIRDKMEYEVKITCQGNAPLSPTTKVVDAVVGVDVGPAMVAISSKEAAWIGPILNKSFIKNHFRDLKLVERGLDRQRRSNNPENFRENKTIISGPKSWDPSNRQFRAYKMRSEAYRKMVAERERQHYELAKYFLSYGNKFVVEDNPYRGWQASLFGKSISSFAPASFIDKLEEKAEAAGGWVKRISTYKTYLSSRCHCGSRKKKGIGIRTHRCPCGVTAQRDLYSAFLARHIDLESLELDEKEIKKEWKKTKVILDKAKKDLIRY